ncbi:MAG: hypothetical protein MHM6MM_000468 [Cercozoa sp. M6MM]
MMALAAETLLSDPMIDAGRGITRQKLQMKMIQMFPACEKVYFKTLFKNTLYRVMRPVSAARLVLQDKERLDADWLKPWEPPEAANNEDLQQQALEVATALHENGVDAIQQALLHSGDIEQVKQLLGALRKHLELPEPEVEEQETGNKRRRTA